MRFRKTLTLLLLAMGLVFALSAWAQQKPFTRDQVQGLARDGLGDESGAKLVRERGIDFAPAEDFLQSLKAAGASEAFLKGVAHRWTTATGRGESNACKTAWGRWSTTPLRSHHTRAES
jgi:hypothetical protein